MDEIHKMAAYRLGLNPNPEFKIELLGKGDLNIYNKEKWNKLGFEFTPQPDLLPILEKGINQGDCYSVGELARALTPLIPNVGKEVRKSKIKSLVRSSEKLLLFKANDEYWVAHSEDEWTIREVIYGGSNGD